jgi:hypothetical protein
VSGSITLMHEVFTPFIAGPTWTASPLFSTLHWPVQELTPTASALLGDGF